MKANGQAMISVWKNDKKCKNKCKLHTNDRQTRKTYRLVSMTSPKLTVHNTCICRGGSFDFKRKGDSPNEKGDLVDHHQKWQYKEKNWRLERWIKVVLGDTLNVKDRLKRAHRLRLKHLKPRAREGELMHDWWFTEWARRAQLISPKGQHVEFWAKIWETINSPMREKEKILFEIEF